MPRISHPLHNIRSGPRVGVPIVPREAPHLTEIKKMHVANPRALARLMRVTLTPQELSLLRLRLRKKNFSLVQIGVELGIPGKSIYTLENRVLWKMALALSALKK